MSSITNQEAKKNLLQAKEKQEAPAAEFSLRRGGEMKEEGLLRKADLKEVKKEENPEAALEEVFEFQSTKDLPIKEITKEAYHLRKEKYGTHHHLEEYGEAPANAHFVG